MKIEIKYTYCWSEGVKTHAQGGPGDKGVEATTLKVTPGSRGARRRRWCWRTAPLMRARSRLLAEPASRCWVSAFSSALAARSPFQMLGNFIRSYNSWQGGRIIWDPGGELETLQGCCAMSWIFEEIYGIDLTSYPRKASALQSRQDGNCVPILSEPRKWFSLADVWLLL